MQSLLGLTDVKLKQELSVLVDTQLWATALQDVKTRKSAAKSRLSELVVETRVRGEELQRLVAQLRDSEGLVARVTADLEAARAVADAEMGHSKNALSIQFGNSSLEEVRVMIIINGDCQMFFLLMFFVVHSWWIGCFSAFGNNKKCSDAFKTQQQRFE